MKAGKLVVALAVLVIVMALVMPVVAGAVARVGSGDPVAAECQSGHSCGGRMIPQSHSPGLLRDGAAGHWGRGMIAEITPTPEPPPGPDAACQSGTSCGG